MTQAAEPSDLLARAAAGDEAAFTALVGPQQRSIFRHCYRMLGSGADAEDAVQDTLERAWRRFGTYDGSGTFPAWLHRVATNICLDILRARKARSDPAGYGPPTQPGSSLAPPDPELAWVEPFSDNDLAGPVNPQDEVVRLEEISLAFVAALQRADPSGHGTLDTGVDVGIAGNPPVGVCPAEELSVERPRHIGVRGPDLEVDHGVSHHLLLSSGTSHPVRRTRAR